MPKSSNRKNIKEGESLFAKNVKKPKTFLYVLRYKSAKLLLIKIAQNMICLVPRIRDIHLKILKDTIFKVGNRYEQGQLD